MICLKKKRTWIIEEDSTYLMVLLTTRRRRPKGPYVPSPFILSQFNTQNLPSKRELYNICKKAEETHEKQLLGTFYISSRVRLQGILLLYEDCQDKGNRYRSQILGK